MTMYRQALVHAIGLLTVFPTPVQHVTPEMQRDSVLWFPVVGALLGCIGWGVLRALTGIFPLPAGVSAILLLLLWAALSGGLHWDGFADVCDGLGVRHRGRDEILRVMADSHSGSFAVLGIVFLVLLQWQLAADILDGGVSSAIAAVPIAGRYAISLCCYFGQPAKSTGLAAGYLRKGNFGQVVALTILTLAGLALCIHIMVCVAILAAMATIAGLVTVGSQRWLGGVTGDLLGFAAICGEAAALLTLSL